MRDESTAMSTVADPPSAMAPPPVKPLPAVTVRDELASSVLSICPAGSETVPADTVRPLLKVPNPPTVRTEVEAEPVTAR